MIIISPFIPIPEIDALLAAYHHNKTFQCKEIKTKYPDVKIMIDFINLLSVVQTRTYSAHSSDPAIQTK